MIGQISGAPDHLAAQHPERRLDEYPIARLLQVVCGKGQLIGCRSFGRSGALHPVAEQLADCRRAPVHTWPAGRRGIEVARQNQRSRLVTPQGLQCGNGPEPGSFVPEFQMDGHDGEGPAGRFHFDDRRVLGADERFLEP